MRSLHTVAQHPAHAVNPLGMLLHDAENVVFAGKRVVPTLRAVTKGANTLHYATKPKAQKINPNQDQMVTENEYDADKIRT
jgi:hypothetical protein